MRQAQQVHDICSRTIVLLAVMRASILREVQMKVFRALVVPAVAFAALAGTASVARAQVTSTTSTSIFGAAVGPVTVETFGSCCHFPIPSPINSFTPGLGLQPGVTYSVTGGPLLIDGGGGFVGGFL